MDLHGAIVVDPASGDPVRQQGFLLNVDAVQSVTTKKHRYRLDGDVLTGHFCTLDDKVRLGPYPTPEEATAQARLYAGVWERAS